MPVRRHPSVSNRLMKREQKKQHRAGVRIAVAVILVCLIVLTGLWVMGRPVGGAKGKSVLVEIPAGSSAKTIASTLKDKSLIRSETVFMLQARLTGSAAKFQAGSYLLTKSQSTCGIIRTIAEGKTASHTFTLEEGEPIYKLAEQLEKDGVCTKAAFYKEIEKGSFHYDFVTAQLPSGTERLEGLLYPDTYSVDLNATAHDVVNRMLHRFDEEVYQKYAVQAKKQGQSFYKIVIKASTIQKEASTKEDMRKVSSVIDNRMKGMPLQMDSIVSYIHKEDKIRATYSDIAVDSDYNPYKNTGLPPGPICSPGLTAIKAALSPADTGYLYFVASPKMDGTNVFSKTYKAFSKDKKAFDKAYEKYIKEHPGAK